MIVRLYNRLLDVLDVVPGAIIGLIALAIGLDVLMRNLGMIGLRGMIEMIEYGLFGLTFIGIASVMRKGAHVSVDIFVTSLPPALRRVAVRISLVVNLAIALALIWCGWIAFKDAVESGAQIYKIFTFPEYVLFIAILAGTILLAIECARHLWRGTGVNAPAKSATDTVDV